MYTLSVREAVKYEEKGCTCEIERTPTESPSISYWCEEGDNGKWPKRPKMLKYERVHSGKEKSHYCISALVS